MSHTTRAKPQGRKRFHVAGRGIAKAKRKIQRICRAKIRQQMRADPGLIYQPKRIHDFWWNWL